MTFWQQSTSTFIGALLAFIFSIFLFYLTEKWKNNRINENLNSNLGREFDYNIHFLETYKTDLEKLLRAVTSNFWNLLKIFSELLRSAPTPLRSRLAFY